MTPFSEQLKEPLIRQECRRVYGRIEEEEEEVPLTTLRLLRLTCRSPLIEPRETVLASVSLYRIELSPTRRGGSDMCSMYLV